MSASHILISYGPEDEQVARFLAGDLERQGVQARPRLRYNVQAVQGVNGAAALVAVVGPASSNPAVMRAEAERVLQDGTPLYAVRVGEVDLGAFGLNAARLVTDAFGPAAQPNVEALAAQLRGLGAPQPATGFPPNPPHAGPPPGQPYGAPSSYGAPPAYGAPPPYGGSPPYWGPGSYGAPGPPPGGPSPWRPAGQSKALQIVIIILACISILFGLMRIFGYR